MLALKKNFFEVSIRYVLVHYEQNHRSHIFFACVKSVNPYLNCGAHNVFAHGIVKVGPVVREESNYCNYTLHLTSSKVTYTSIAGVHLLRRMWGFSVLRYWPIFLRYFSKFNRKVLYSGLIEPRGMRFFIISIDYIW